MSTSKKIFGRWDDIPPQFFFWASVILIVIPYLYPLGTPIVITPYTRSWVNAMEDVPEGGYIVFSLDSAMGGIIETGGAMAATLKYYVNTRPDVHIIIWGLHYDAPLVYSTIVEPLVQDLNYGVNYIWLGYIPGGETAVSKLADDIQGMLLYDFEGKPTRDFPIMENIKNAEDIDLLCYFTTGLVPGYIAHWYERYGTPLLDGGLAGGISSAAMYIAAGQIKGFSAGVRGSAELEQLLGYPSFATSTLDALNVMNVFIIFVLILANIVYHGFQRKGGLK